jgi:hypothetical protein
MILRSGKSTGASGKATLPTSPISHKEASCKVCSNRTDEKPPFCKWMLAEIPQGVPDDPTCEGFVPKNLGTSKGKAGMGIRERMVKNLHKFLQVMPLKGDVDRDLNPGELPKTRMHATCPKKYLLSRRNYATWHNSPDKSLVQTALKLKGLGGSVVMERICCGKPGCHCHTGALHGPYPYLHYYSSGKVRRRYLSKTVSALLSHSRDELEKMLHETEESQETRQCGFEDKSVLGSM